MFTLLTIVTPVFGIILLGWLAQRFGALSPGGSKVLAEFGFKVAIPALLFRAALSAGPLVGSPTRLLATYLGALTLTWIAATLSTAFLLKRPAADGAAIAMGACFGNTVMLGIPLVLTAFGPEAAAPMAFMVAVETPLLWIVASLHMALADRDDRQRSATAPRELALDLITNPIVVALVLGVAARAAGLSLPAVPDRILELLAGAAVPTALFALGMSLATYEIKGQAPTLTAICVLKLAVYPAAAAGLAVYAFELPPLWTAVVVMFAAMPVGANAYLFAARYERAVGSVSGAIAISTAIAVITASALLYVLEGAAP